MTLVQLTSMTGELTLIENLTYNIVEERLRGHFGGICIDCSAGSGGRAGTKTKDAGNWYLQNNALATHVHYGAHQFGPLPQGYYYMSLHEKHSHMIRLEPFPSNIMYGRGGFLIHGRGKIGSHGCIVPYDFHNVIMICSGVSSYIKNNKTKPVLRVIAVGTNIGRKFFTA